MRWIFLPAVADVNCAGLVNHLVFEGSSSPLARGCQPRICHKEGLYLPGKEPEKSAKVTISSCVTKRMFSLEITNLDGKILQHAARE